MMTHNNNPLSPPCAMISESEVSGRRAPVASQTPRQPRYLSLDLWRGVACVVVVMYHSTEVQHNYQEMTNQAGSASGLAAALFAALRWFWLGVPMFFVISGYCIAATADTTRRRPQGISSYFFRRFRRIYPPYWAAVALTAIVVAAFDCFLTPGLFTRGLHPSLRAWWLSGWQMLGNLSLTETWRYHLVGGTRGYILTPAWTLCYEEQFYVATGLLLLISKRHFFKLATALSLLCLATSFGSRWLQIAIDGFFFDGHWFLFAAGILVYYQINYATSRQSFCITLFLVFCFVFSLIGPPLIINCGPTTENRVRIAFGFALFISLIHPLDGWICSRPWLRPLMFCGTLCYSLYLVHAPIALGVSQALHSWGIRDVAGTLLITVPLCLFLSLLAAWLFHIFIERRFLNPPHQAAKPMINGEQMQKASVASTLAVSTPSCDSNGKVITASSRSANVI